MENEELTKMILLLKEDMNVQKKEVVDLKSNINSLKLELNNLLSELDIKNKKIEDQRKEIIRLEICAKSYLKTIKESNDEKTISDLINIQNKNEIIDLKLIIKEMYAQSKFKDTQIENLIKENSSLKDQLTKDNPQTLSKDSVITRAWKFISIVCKFLIKKFPSE